MQSMKATVRVRRHLDSETIYLPDEAAEPADQFPLRGSVIKYEDPVEPVAEEDWEATA